MSVRDSIRGQVIVIGVSSVLLTLLVLSGVIPKDQIIGICFPVLVGTVVIANLNRLAALSFAEFAVLGLVFLHSLNVFRYMHIFYDNVVFDAGRLPLSLMVALPVVVAGWKALLTGPGFAACGVPTIYLCWAGLSSGFGLDPQHSYFYAGWLMFMCALISISRGLNKEPEEFWRKWLMGLMLVGLLTSVLSLLAMALDLPNARYQRWVAHNEAPGFRGLFFNANILCSGALLSLASALSLAYLDKNSRKRWLEPVLAICGVTILLSGSRAGFLGILSALFCYGYLLYSTRSRSRKETSGLAIAPAAILILGLIILAISPVGRVGLDRLLTSEELTNRSYAGREDVWMSFLNSMVENPIFGSGYMSQPTAADWETTRLLPQQRAVSAHSAPIEYGTTTGIVGLLLFLYMLWGGLTGLTKPGYRRFSASAIVFWLCSAPIFLLYAHGNSPSSPAVWPLWVLLLTCRSLNGQPSRGEVAPPWVLRISPEEERQFRAAMPRRSATGPAKELPGDGS